MRCWGETTEILQRSRVTLSLSYLPSSPCFSSETLPTSFLGAQNKPSILSLSCKAPFYCWPLRHTPQKNTHFQIMTPACQDLSQRCQLSFRETEIIWKDIVEISRDKDKREVKGPDYRSGRSFQKSYRNPDSNIRPVWADRLLFIIFQFLSCTCEDGNMHRNKIWTVYKE